MTGDDWICFLDRWEYRLRRLACRIVGHRWAEVREWAGDASYLLGYFCERCGKSDP